jgi:leucyl-tRNA synthetase
VRDRVVVARDASKEAIEEAARSSAKVIEAVGAGTVVKVVVVPGKLVNVVVK